MISNDRAGVVLAQPKKDDERLVAAQVCSKHLELGMPLVVDTIDDHVGNLYSGMPDRLYLIDSDGKVSYKSGRGPFGFKPGELEQEVVLLMLDKAGVATAKPQSGPPAGQRRVAPKALKSAAGGEAARGHAKH